MLKLVFCIKDSNLKVREAFPGEVFNLRYTWMNRLEFTLTENSDFTMIWTSLLPDLGPQYAQALLDLVAARYPVSSKFSELFKLCPELAFKNHTDEWVFYGGTFDPWHRGHQSCLDLIPDEKICLILPDRNPQKKFRELDPVSAILEISTKARFKKNQFLVPSFLLDDRKNPTIEWIEKIKHEFPNDKRSLLMGFDSFSQIKTWIRFEDLLNDLQTIYVVSRMETEEEREISTQDVKSSTKELNVVFLGRHRFEDLSSTDIRKRLGKP